jgi:hypothetical protein
MSKGIQELMASWDGKGVVCRHDRQTGTWIFICLHNDSLGPATGGSRMKVYPELGDALEDGMRLAEGMTYKWAGIGVAAGGGKAVLATPVQLEGEDRRGLLHRYGELIESLRGTCSTPKARRRSIRARSPPRRSTPESRRRSTSCSTTAPSAGERF